MALGLVIGTVSYRSAYAAVFDSRYNHIPLPPFAAKTRFLYLKAKMQQLPDTSDKDEEQEVDRLVVWSWWKLGPNEQNRVKEEFWLQNIRTTRAAGCESGFKGEPTLPQNQHDIYPWDCVGARSDNVSGGNTSTSQYESRALGIRCASHTASSRPTMPAAQDSAPTLGSRAAGVEAAVSVRSESQVGVRKP